MGELQQIAVSIGALQAGAVERQRQVELLSGKHDALRTDLQALTVQVCTMATAITGLTTALTELKPAVQETIAARHRRRGATWMAGLCLAALGSAATAIGGLLALIGPQRLVKILEAVG
jgi:hypothetical protein